MARSESRPLFRDPLVLVFLVLILVALAPIPFLTYRLLNAGGGQGIVVPVLPSATPTDTPLPAPTATPTATPTPLPSPTPTPSVREAPLSGLPLPIEQLRYPLIAVMIPSDSDQYGLSQAAVVYEASAEYRIQRFLAIFEQVEAPKLGPIRSARLYYVEWAHPYGLLFVHWGGSPQAYERLAQIRCRYDGRPSPYPCLHVLDGQDGGRMFWRAEVVDIPWNNGFTSSNLLYDYLQEKDISRSVDYLGYPHKEDAPQETRPLTGTISISGFHYPVRYTYDPESNTYGRDFKGRPHLDLLTGEQIRAHNVVLIFVPQAPIPGDPKGRLDFQTTGEGEAWFFLDGLMLRGRWVKESVEAELRFFDEAGQEVAFNRGNIWIEVLAPGQEVEVKPGPTP